MGRNLGIRRDIFHRLDRRMDYIQRHDPQPGSLIGWSLGGLIAREYAKYAPDRVAKVITLGSPFSGDLRANHAWRIYELVARHRIDSPPLPVKLTEKPPVPTYAIWSGNDRSEEHTSELQSLMRISYAVFCLKQTNYTEG